MTRRRWIALGLVALAVAWFFRLEVIAAERGIYLVNRWTGEVRVCYPDGCTKL